MFRVCSTGVSGGKHSKASYWSAWSTFTRCENMFTHPVASVRCRSGLRRARSLPGIDRLRTLLKQASAVRSPALTVALSCEDVVTDHYLLGLGASSLIRRLRGRLYRRFRRRRFGRTAGRDPERPTLQARSDCTVAQRRAGEEGGRRAEPAQVPPQDARSPSHRRRRPAGPRAQMAAAQAGPKRSPSPSRADPNSLRSASPGCHAARATSCRRCTVASAPFGYHRRRHLRVQRSSTQSKPHPHQSIIRFPPPSRPAEHKPIAFGMHFTRWSPAVSCVPIVMRTWST